MQLMLKANEENEDGVSRLSEDEIMAQSITFFLAGFQTTGNRKSKLRMRSGGSAVVSGQ